MAIRKAYQPEFFNFGRLTVWLFFWLSILWLGLKYYDDISNGFITAIFPLSKLYLAVIMAFILAWPFFSYFKIKREDNKFDWLWQLILAFGSAFWLWWQIKETFTLLALILAIMTFWLVFIAERFLTSNK